MATPRRSPGTTSPATPRPETAWCSARSSSATCTSATRTAAEPAVRRSCSSSKRRWRRLQTDYVDIYWIHNWDQGTPIEETLRALDDLVAAGKIRYAGLSDFPAWKASEAQTIAHLRGWTPAAAIQLEFIMGTMGKKKPRARRAAALTIRRIAADVEYMAPIVYQHFANRDALVLELVTHGYDLMLAESR